MSHFHVVSRRDFFFQRESSYQMPRIQNVTIGQGNNCYKILDKSTWDSKGLCVFHKLSEVWKSSGNLVLKAVMLSIPPKY